MKKIKNTILLIFLFLGTTLVSAVNVNPGQDSIYKYDEISIIELTMSDDDFQSLIYPEDPEANIYYKADLRFKNSLMDKDVKDVGVRIRGNTSRYNTKKSIKIDFKEFGGEKFHDYKKFNLKAEVNDPSLIREFLGLYVYRKYEIPAARAHHCQLYINGEYMGVYLNVEQIDDEFFDHRYDTETGNVYKCFWGATLENSSEVYNDDFYRLKTNEDVNDRSLLLNLVNTLNSNSGEKLKSKIEPIFNVELYLRQMAVETLLGHWDGYSFNSNNFYLYENPNSGKILFVPYDLDNTFGIDWMGFDWAVRDVTNWSSEWMGVPLTNKLLEIDEYFEGYCRHMLTLNKYYFNREHLDPVMDAVQAVISDAVNNDSYYTIDRGYTFTDFQNALDEAWGSQVYYGIKPYIGTRETTALGQLGSYEPYDSPEYIPDDNGTSIFNTFSDQQIKIYPNPVKNGYFFMKSEFEDATIIIYDQLGRDIKINYFYLGNGEYRLVFNQEPAPGWYVLKIDNLVQQFIVH